MSKPRTKLSDIVDAIDSASEMSSAYLDRQTGAVVVITEGDVEAATDEDAAANAPDWQQEAIEQARAIEADEAGRFLPLPDKFDAHEWDMMKRYCGTVQNLDASEQLHEAIRGSGAFRRFQDAARRLGLLDGWNKYRDEQYLALAREWCEENGVEYEGAAKVK